MNNTSPMDIASRIRLERQKRSWTQEQLAERAGLATRTVQRIESGADASPETLRLIAEAFGIPAETLLPAKTRVHFGAPADQFVRLVTGTILVLTAVLLVAGAFTHIPTLGDGGLFLLAVVFLAGFFTVSGYSVRDGMLTIHRFGGRSASISPVLEAWRSIPSR